MLSNGGIVIVMLWIGVLKAFHYEAAGIVPIVANSPLMNFFYKFDVPEYKQHVNKEGESRPDNVAWQQANQTYTFSYGLGTVIVLIGLMGCAVPGISRIISTWKFPCHHHVACHLVFLLATPETWVPSLGDTEHGSPIAEQYRSVSRPRVSKTAKQGLPITLLMLNDGTNRTRG